MLDSLLFSFPQIIIMVMARSEVVGMVGDESPPGFLAS
jgi:hypothetical protein